MKQLHRTINVLTNPQGHPSGLNGPQKPIAVRQILDFWRYGGRWWLDEPPRDYYRLELVPERLGRLDHAVLESKTTEEVLALMYMQGVAEALDAFDMGELLRAVKRAPTTELEA